MTSYWTKRRRVQAKIEENLQFIADIENSESSLEPDEPRRPNSPESCKDSDIEEKYDVSALDQNSSLIFFGDAGQEIEAHSHQSIPQKSREENDDNLDSLEVELDSDSIGNEDEKLPESLANWAVKHKISCDALSALLIILGKFHPFLPKDPSTLLGTTQPHMPPSNDQDVKKKKQDLASPPPPPASSVPMVQDSAGATILSAASTSQGERVTEDHFKEDSSPQTSKALETLSVKRWAIIDVKLDEIIQEQQTQKRMLNQLLLQFSGPVEEGEVQLPESCSFPLESLEELDELDGLLKEDKTLVKAVVKTLNLIGGSTTKEMVRRVMGHVMKNDLALQLNWTGKAMPGKVAKRAFGVTSFSEVVTRSVLKNHLLKTSEAEIQKEMMTWLRNAGDRVGGRKRRAEK